MSDYFAGLIRAMGFAPVRAVAPTGLEPAPDASAAPREHPAKVVTERPLDPLASHLPEPARPPIAAVAITKQDGPPLAHVEIDAPDILAPARAAPTTLETALEAALNWVAEAPKEAPGEIAIEQPQLAGHSTNRTEPNAASSPARSADPVPATVMLADRPRLPLPFSQAPMPEPVEVSIGEIHLRIDAPPPQLVARPPAPVPRALAGGIARRSSLGRRAIGGF